MKFDKTEKNKVWFDKLFYNDLRKDKEFYDLSEYEY